jgi:uncharacterized protein YqkB
MFFIKKMVKKAMMKYERKMCDNCKLNTLHRVDDETGDSVCLKCNNEPIKVKDYRFKTRY